jgi:hypothetical protein
VKQETRIMHSTTQVAALILALLVFSGAAFAKKQPRTYPEQGKVIGTGTSGRNITAGSMNSGTGSVSSRTVYSRVYKVESDTKIFELDCGKLPVFSSTGGECGGDKKIQIGDVIHFRVEKGWAYIQAPESDNPDNEQNCGSSVKI